MKKYFLPYAESLELKELGFDEKCCATYNTFNKKLSGLPIEDMEGKPDNCLEYGWRNSLIYKTVFTAPLIQQAKEFLREKHKLHIEITSYYGEHYYVTINEIRFPRKIQQNRVRVLNEYKTYEEAELEAIRECIKIIKNE